MRFDRNTSTHAMALFIPAAAVFVGGMGLGALGLRRINNLQQEIEANDDAASVAAGAPSVIFVLGGPGSGKGTNCARIVDTYGYVHLSAGDLLRAERKSGSDLGEMIEGHIQAGSIVPAEVTVRLLRQAMEQSGESKFLVDGFPRNAENLQIWERDMKHCVVEFVLMLECTEAVMETRLIKRGQTSGRTDDNVEAIRKRFKTYHQSTMPIIKHFEKLGKVKFVNSDRDPELVFADVSALFGDAAAPVRKDSSNV